VQLITAEVDGGDDATIAAHTVFWKIPVGTDDGSIRKTWSGYF